MERSLQIHKLVPVLVEPDKIGLDIEAALTETDEGVDFAVPNVTFEVRIGIRKVYEKKSDAQTGQFIANNVEVGEVDPQFDVTISASDQNGKLSVNIQKDASTLLKEIKDRQEAKGKHVNSKTKPRDVNPPNDQAFIEPELSPAQVAELAEKERQIKRVITEALARLLNKRYCTNTTGEIWDPPSEEHINTKIHFELEKGWIQSEKNLKYVPNSWDHIPNSGDIARSDILVLKANQNHSLVKRKIIETARELPITFIDNLDCFYETSWAEEVISELAKINPQAILKKLIEFYKYDWAKNVVSKIANSNPDLVFNLIELFEYHPWAGEVAMIAAAHDPKSAIENYDKYRDRPWAEEVLDFANIKNGERIIELEKSKKEAKEAKERELNKETERNKTAKIESAIAVFKKNPVGEEARDALRTFLYYQGDERVISAVNSLVKTHPKIFLSNDALYASASWGEQVTEQLCECYPLAKYHLLLERFYGHELTLENLSAAIGYIDSLEGIAESHMSKRHALGDSQNWNELERLIQSPEGIEGWAAMENSLIVQGYVSYFFDNYKSYKCGREILETIVKKYPIYAVIRFEIFESEPWAKNILQIAAPFLVRQGGNMEFLKNSINIFEKYESEDWCTELLNSKRESLKGAEIVNERNQWLKKAEQHRLNTAKEVLANHINKPWAEEVLKKTCENDGPVCKVVFDALDRYATQPWAKNFYLNIVKLWPDMVLRNWPRNTYGWDSELVDILTRHYSEKYRRDLDSKQNPMIDFCLKNPSETLVASFIDRLNFTDPLFARHLKRRKFLGIF